MKKFLPILIIGILVLSGLGASAINVEKENNKNNNYTSGGKATHTPLAEFGTSTTCGFCKYAHGALMELYEEGQLDFYYVTLVCNKNSKAYARARNDFNLYGYPTVWWDGGYRVNIGAGSVSSAKSAYTSSINSCGARSVSDVDITLKATWMGGTSVKVECEVKNNEASKYGGTVRVFIVEKESSMGWKDAGGHLYTMAFLDFAIEKEISIAGGGTWSDSNTWNGVLNGFSSVTKDNTFVIAAVYNDEWHQGYSYPPNNPFDAYYVDDTAGINPATTNEKQDFTRIRQIIPQFQNLLERFFDDLPILRNLIK